MHHRSLLELRERALRDELRFHLEVLARLRVIVRLERLVVKQSLFLVNYLRVHHVFVQIRLRVGRHVGQHDLRLLSHSRQFFL